MFVETINGVSPSDWMVRNGDKEILAPKTFAGSLTITSDAQLSGLFNGYNLTELWEKCLKLDADQDITSPQSFKKLNINK